MKTIEVVVHSIAEDGLPDIDNTPGEIAFIFDGCIVSGWPLQETDHNGNRYWEADPDVGRVTMFGGVTHWLQLPHIRDE